MVKVLVRSLKTGKGKPRKSVARTRVRDASGELVQFYTIDANSPTFESDLTAVYKANVANARSENKKLFGSFDSVPKLRRRVK